jgi:plasmid stabilization system protein ParE
MIYNVQITKFAKQDIETVIDYIENKLFVPLTAEHFLRGIYAKIAELEWNASIYALSTYWDVLAYGNNARHITYKGFAIIYTIHENIVVVHRIIHGSLIKK